MKTLKYVDALRYSFCPRQNTNIKTTLNLMLHCTVPFHFDVLGKLHNVFLKFIMLNKQNM